MRFLKMLESNLPVVNEARTVTRNGKPVIVRAHINRYLRIDPVFKALFVIALFSGCRRGELLALTWDCVDLEKSRICIQKAAAYTRSTGTYIKPPKSAAGYRNIILPSAAMEELYHLKQRQQDRAHRDAACCGKNAEENLVFCNAQGGMLSGSAPRQELARLIKRYNRAQEYFGHPELCLPVLTFHQLRHTSASLLISQGIDPVAAAARLGHANATVTLRIYAHSFRERDVAAADALASVLCP